MLFPPSSFESERDALTVDNSTHRGLIHRFVVILLYLLRTKVTSPNLLTARNTTRFTVSALSRMDMDKGPKAFTHGTTSLLRDLTFLFVSQKSLHSSAVRRGASPILALGRVRKEKQMKLH